MSEYRRVSERLFGGPTPKRRSTLTVRQCATTTTTTDDDDDDVASTSTRVILRRVVSPRHTRWRVRDDGETGAGDVRREHGDRGRAREQWDV